MTDPEEYRMKKFTTKTGEPIEEATAILKIYKNGNFKIPGRRSISLANLHRMRGALLHHSEVRLFIRLERFKGNYLQAVKGKKEDKKNIEKWFKRYLEYPKKVRPK